jgi:hypothetical protein
MKFYYIDTGDYYNDYDGDVDIDSLKTFLGYD